MRSFILQNLAKYLYTTLIQPIFSYGDSVYDGMNLSNKSILQVLQNSSLRAVKRCARDYSEKELHDDLEIAYLQGSHRKSALKIVYCGLHNNGPTKLNARFNFYEPTRSMHSAMKQLILPPKTHTMFGENDIKLRGSRYWNDLDDNLKLEILKAILNRYGPV